MRSCTILPFMFYFFDVFLWRFKFIIVLKHLSFFLLQCDFSEVYGVCKHSSIVRNLYYLMFLLYCICSIWRLILQILGWICMHMWIYIRLFQWIVLFSYWYGWWMQLMWSVSVIYVYKHTHCTHSEEFHQFLEAEMHILL